MDVTISGVHGHAIHNSSEYNILNLNIVYGFSVVIIGLYFDDESIKIDGNDRNE